MRMALSPGRRLLLLGASSITVLTYLGFALTDYSAARLSEKTDLTSLQRAVQLQPWDAASLYSVLGDTEEALREFRTVLEHDPYLPPAALQLCWRIKPDIDGLLRDVVPPIAAVYTSFLDFLISRKETESAAKVWTQLAALHQPVEQRHVFDYMRYLVSRQEVDQAR